MESHEKYEALGERARLIRSKAGALDQLLLTTGFSIPDGGIGGTQITVDYASMPGNQPTTYGDTLFIWQTSQPQVPINTPPFNPPATVTPNTPDGSYVYQGLTVTSLSYLLAYGVGPNVANICATVFVPAVGGGGPTLYQPSVTLSVLGPTSITFAYSMPPGMQPQTNGDWVGLWQGQSEAALYSVPPTWFTPVGSNSFSGNGALNGVTILRGTTYTLGYFKGGYSATSPSKQTTLACSTTFST